MKHPSDRRSEMLSGTNGRSPTQPAFWSARSARRHPALCSSPGSDGVGVALGSVKRWGGGCEMSRVKGKGSRQGHAVVCDSASVSRVGK